MTKTKATIHAKMPIQLLSAMEIPIPIMDAAANNAIKNNGHLICFNIYTSIHLTVLYFKLKLTYHLYYTKSLQDSTLFVL